MQTTDQPVSDTSKAALREQQQRAELLRDLKLDTKTEAEKAVAQLNRVQLFSFLTEVMAGLLDGKVLLSRPNPNRMWCQTGFYVKENQVLAKFGEALMQPIGWDTGTEFWMTSASKFLWKHEFLFVDVKAGAIETPFEVTIQDRPEVDGEGIKPKERENLARIAKDISELLDLKRPEDFKRDPDFAPKAPKAKWGPGELIEKVRAWLQENEARISQEAHAEVDAKLMDAVYEAPYATYVAEATKQNQAVTDILTWARGSVASRIAEEQSSAFAKGLAAETAPYAEAELDALAWRQEHRERCVEALKYWSLNSRNFDDRMRKLFAEHPELNDDFDNADILGLLASVVAWANTALTDDRIDRVIKNTVTTARIGPDGIQAAEAKMASKLLPMVASAREALGKKVEDIPDNDPRLLRAMGVVSQARIALPAVEARIQELSEVLIDVALDEIAKVLKHVIDLPGIGMSIGNPNCVAKVAIQVPEVTPETKIVDIEPPKA